MKPENENHAPSSDAFERELSSFRRTAPPEEWRDKLLANAIPPAEPNREEKQRVARFRFNRPEKFFAGGLAAAWLAIFGLWIATPDHSQTAKVGPSTLAEPSIPIQAEPFSMLAWRFSQNGEPAETLIP
jgi:hypothetical protein